MNLPTRLAAIALIACLITQPVLALEEQTVPTPAEETSDSSALSGSSDASADAADESATEQPGAEEDYPMPEASIAEPEGDYVAGEVLVKFSDSIDLDRSRGEAAAEAVVEAAGIAAAPEAGAGTGLEIEEIVANANVAVVDTGRLSTGEAIAALGAAAGVEYVEPNYVYAISAIDANDSFRGLQWALENTGQGIGNGSATTTGAADSDIDGAEAFALSRGAGVIVAVIDTGVDYTHPDLADRMWDGTSCVNEGGAPLGGCIHGYDFRRNDVDPMPEFDHGTHVAGTIAASIDNGQGVIGVAPEATIMALRADFQFQDQTVLATADIIRAIDFARYNGAQVINASFGGGDNSMLMAAAIEDFGLTGGIFVAAAGNSAANIDSAPSYPASYNSQNLIAVAASTQTDALASFSNYGTTSVDIAAPGVNILSTVPGGWAFKNGTSMATPHVAGMAAQIIAYGGSLSVPSIRAALLSGDTVSGLATSTATGKRANAFSALTSLGYATTSSLTVRVDVVNDNAGTATSTDFTWNVNGAAAQSIATSTGTTSAALTVSPGRYYTVAGTAASGYDLSASNCTKLVLAAGTSATCTLTYNDIAPQVSSGGGGGGGGGSSRRGGGGGGGGGSSKKSDSKSTTTKKATDTKKTTTKTPQPTKAVTKMPVVVPSATPASPRFTTDRAIGAQGSDVSELQRTLAAKGYLGVAPTGYYGQLTADALRRYQAANGLAQTGTLDTATRAKLNAETGTAAKPAVIGVQGGGSLQAQIALLQQQLAALMAQAAAKKGR